MFVLALAFIYLVLSAQFESFRDPMMIMLTVPLSMTGALAALYYSGGTPQRLFPDRARNLVGLITKHGILIVEFANQMQAQGKTRFEAVIEAASLRLRPILMTTSAMILGALPWRWHRCRCGKPAADRLGDRRRTGARHAAHSLRDTGGLYDRRSAERDHGGGAGAGRRIS